MDCVAVVSGAKTGVAVPDWELGCLDLRDANAGEVVSAVTLGACQGALVTVDAVAHMAEGIVLFGGSCFAGHSGIETAAPSAWRAGCGAAADLETVAVEGASFCRAATATAEERPAGSARSDAAARVGCVRVSAHRAASLAVGRQVGCRGVWRSHVVPSELLEAWM